jgi:hypothetical protein
MSTNDDIVARAQALAMDLLAEVETRLARVREAEVKLTEAQAELRERQTRYDEALATARRWGLPVADRDAQLRLIVPEIPTARETASEQDAPRRTMTMHATARMMRVLAERGEATESQLTIAAYGALTERTRTLAFKRFRQMLNDGWVTVEQINESARYRPTPEGLRQWEVRRHAV